MPKNLTINLKVVEKVAHALEELNKEVVYVGGAVVSLYVTDEGAEQPRPTKDIDLSVKISTYAQMDHLREKLATKRIFPANSESMIYRFVHDDILLDFIPHENTPLGPTNRWFKSGFDRALSVDIGKTQIRILPVSHFLATKWEAYKSRGGDPRTSHDFEDIIYTIDNNLNVVEETAKSPHEIRGFLKEMSMEILEHPSSKEIIECHINPYTAERRGKLVIEKLHRLIT